MDELLGSNACKAETTSSRQGPQDAIEAALQLQGRTSLARRNRSKLDSWHARRSASAMTAWQGNDSTQEKSGRNFIVGILS